MFLICQNLTFFPKSKEKFFPNLESIDLSRNLITTSTTQQLRPHENVTTLLLQYNQITTPKNNTFKGSTHLKIAVLCYNNITLVGYNVNLIWKVSASQLKNESGFITRNSNSFRINECVSRWR